MLIARFKLAYKAIHRMRYVVLACDYDGTLASEGGVPGHVVESLERVKSSGRRLILVSGRQLEDLTGVFPQSSMFDVIVAENGAVLRRPDDRRPTILAEQPSPRFVDALRQRRVSPLFVGHVIVSTWEPNERIVLETIHELGLELHVIFNKGAVMVLPSGINKASGLHAALEILGVSHHNVVGIGDAENDHAFLSACECSVVVENALSSLKERADLVTTRPQGEGVSELIELLVGEDLKSLDPRLTRHDILLGERQDGTQLRLGSRRRGVLIAGPSGSGKSSICRGLLEQLIQARYQFCLIDPEGDYENLEGVMVVGGPEPNALLTEAVNVLTRPERSVVVSLSKLGNANRPDFFHAVFPRLQELRAQKGRPHWIVIDEAHHLLPSAHATAPLALPQEATGILFITVHPDHLSEGALGLIDVVICVGPAPSECLSAVHMANGRPLPVRGISAVPGQVIAWELLNGEPYPLRPVEPETERRRHQRKYAEGTLGEDKSFFFRGPEGRLNLRAQNLMMFIQLAEGVDDETWLFHLGRGDYSRWFSEAIKDEELARVASDTEANRTLGADESRALIRSAISARYTEPG